MIYNVTLSSTTRSSGSVSQAVYDFNFNVLPEGRYRMTSNFVSSTCNNSQYPNIAMLEVSLGQSSVYKTIALSTTALVSQCIALLKANTNTTNSFLYCDSINCIPVILNRPCNNQINVKIMTHSVTPTLWTDCQGTALTDYVLILSFEKL